MVMMPSITAKSSKGTLAVWETIPSSLCCQTKFARFLFEFHAVRFESLDLPLIPADQSDFDVHAALDDDKVKMSITSF